MFSLQQHQIDTRQKAFRNCGHFKPGPQSNDYEEFDTVQYNPIIF